MRGPHNIWRLVRTGATFERTGAMKQALEALEEGVVFVGTFTRDGTRRLVFYARESSAAMPAFEAFAARVAWSTEVVVERDVRWEWLRRFG